MRALGVLSLLVLLAGCADPTTTTTVGGGGGGDSSQGPTPASSAAPGELVIQVRSGGGLMPATGRITDLPRLSIYRDGRLIVPGQMILPFPAPALPVLQVRQLTSAQVDGLVEQGRTAGVGTVGDLGQPQVADAPSTTFFVAGRTTEVNALGIGGDGGLTQQQIAGRKALQGLLDVLDKVGAGTATPYVPTSVVAVATPYTGTQGGLPSPPPADAWPGPPLPGRTTTAYGCVVASGDQATAVLALAAHANTETPWTSGGARWRLQFRPLLPDETGCADLGK